MDETMLEERLAEELISGWEIMATGNGFLVMTDWRWPGDEKIEIHVRRVADREDLYLVTDGGELHSLLFANGIDLRQDQRSMDLLLQTTAGSGAAVVDYQIVRGSSGEELPRSVRQVLEAVKEGAFMFWRQLRSE